MMRALFLEYLADAVREAGLGIAYGCLVHITTQIDAVVASNAIRLRDRIGFRSAYEEFEEFVARMIEDARTKNYTELHEDTFFAAKDRCGLVFWCA